MTSRFGGEASETIKVSTISVPPLGEILELPRDSNFSLFIPKHRRIAGKLIDIFLGLFIAYITLNSSTYLLNVLGVRSVDDLLSVAVYARDRVNPYLFNYALSVALLHRSDTQDLDVPSIIHSFPDKYVDSKVFTKAREDATVIPVGARVRTDLILCLFFALNKILSDAY